MGSISTVVQEPAWTYARNASASTPFPQIPEFAVGAQSSKVARQLANAGFVSMRGESRSCWFGAPRGDQSHLRMAVDARGDDVANRRGGVIVALDIAVMAGAAILPR